MRKTFLLCTLCIFSFLFNAAGYSVTGPSSLCETKTATYTTDISSGGTWRCTNTTSAGTIDSITGIFTAKAISSTQLSTITYKKGSDSASITITVNLAPNGITHNAPICVSAQRYLVNTTPGGGGIWSCSDTAKLSVDSLTGLMVGKQSGNLTITYQLPTGCRATAGASVKGLISGTMTTGRVCDGQTLSLSVSVSSGSWSSNDGGIATVGSTGTSTANATATNTSAAPQTVSIQYINIFTGGCVVGWVTVDPSPAITGAATVCVAATVALAAASGGTWSSSNAGIATVGSTGIVSGVAAGIDTITYTMPAGCFAIKVITVNALPVITGTLTGCSGTTTTLNGTPGGGEWVASGPSEINASGIVTFATEYYPGETAIQYVHPTTGCTATVNVTANPIPFVGSDFSEIFAVCVGSKIDLVSDFPSPPGTWSSSNTAIATVGTAILYDSPRNAATGLLAGTTSISFTTPDGCISSKILTVNIQPAAITGALSVCVGSTTTLSDTTSGGSWSSNYTSSASIGTTGIVTGVSPSIDPIISYTMPSGCYSVVAITVNALADIFSYEGSAVCAGFTKDFSCYTDYPGDAGGIWSSGTTSIATVGTTSSFDHSIVTGIAAGTANLTYTTSEGCNSTIIVTVMPSPAPITGNFNVCAESAAVMSCSTPGGIWSAESFVINPVSGIINTTDTLYPGIGDIVYTMPNGCYSTVVVTVNPDPIIQSADNQYCSNIANIPIGIYSSYGSYGLDGIWSSSNTAIATVGSTAPPPGLYAGAIITIVTPGVVTISYTLSTGCASTKTLTVQATPTVTSSLLICANEFVQFTSDVPGGEWIEYGGPFNLDLDGQFHSAFNHEGTADITYTAYYGDLGCSVSVVVTVNYVPAITGTTSVCEGYTTLLSNSTSGGTWSSSNSSIAGVGTTGLVTGVAAGTTQISYTLGCTRTATVTVNECGGRPEDNGYSGMPDARQSYTLSPNPSNGNIIIQQNIADNNAAHVKVVTMLGAVAYDGTLHFEGGKSSLQLTNVASGIYLVHITGYDGTINTIRMVIEQ